MSRAALWRQEGNVKERERKANETFENALDEGRSRSQKGLIPMISDDKTFNLNPMLLHNISKSPYFQKACDKLKDWTSLVDEIYYEMKHAEPWGQGAAKTPSTAFCLLLRTLCLRVTEKQMKSMLDHVDSPYIRVIGFLYLRYAADPTILFEWFQPYLYDEEVVRIEVNVKKGETTIGKFVRGLLTSQEYYGTRLPRLPAVVEREITTKLGEAAKIEERALEHLKDSKMMEYFQRLGSKVQALYGDESNPVTWYDAVIDRVLLKDDNGVKFYRPKFVVTFTEYGNTETVTIGEMDMPGVDHTVSSSDVKRESAPYHDRHRGDRDRDRSYDRGRETRHHDDRDRDHRRDYNRGSYRYDDRNSRDRSFSQNSRSNDERDRRFQQNDRDHRQRDRSRSRDRDLSERDRSDIARREPFNAALESLKSATASVSSDNVSGRDNADRYSDGSRNAQIGRCANGADVRKHPVKKSREELAAIAEKKRKLMSKYG
uniref:Pre-mRNA-splicing factor 38 n=2 Tax=Chaetoceros debilis TaxID=122233 RepID=A0A7S3VCK6_9STRA